MGNTAMEQIYVAKVWSKSGHILYKTTKAHTTREAAALEAFTANKKARECSTSMAKLERIGPNDQIIDYGRNIQWHQREEIVAGFEAPEAEGMAAPSSRKAAAKATADKYLPRGDKTGKSAAKKMLTPTVMKGRADKYVTKDGDKPVPPSADDLRKVIEKSIHRLTEAKAEFAGTADDAREVWLRRMAKLLEPWFKRAGYDVPAYRVSVGWTSKGVRTRRIGECWDAKVSADGSYQIFISPTQVDSEMVAGILAHELIHAVVGIKAGHGAKFKRCGITALGFEGNASTMCTGKAFKENIQPLLAELGPFPHAKLKPGISSTGRKQPTRMIKCECRKCGYIARTTEKWINTSGPPVCPAHLVVMKAFVPSEHPPHSRSAFVSRIPVRSRIGPRL